MTASIYGHDIELPQIDPGETATDIIVITRTVGFDDDGRPYDDLYVGGTQMTTGIIHNGMLNAALDGMHLGAYEEGDQS